MLYALCFTLYAFLEVDLLVDEPVLPSNQDRERFGQRLTARICILALPSTFVFSWQKDLDTTITPYRIW